MHPGGGGGDAERNDGTVLRKKAVEGTIQELEVQDRRGPEAAPVDWSAPRLLKGGSTRTYHV
jgi:hypothetical protein